MSGHESAPFAQPGVQRRVLWVFVLANALAVVAAGLVSRHFLESWAIDRWLEDREAQVRQLGHWCDSEIVTARRGLEALAELGTFQSLAFAADVDPALHGLPLGLDMDKRRHLRLLFESHPQFSVLFVLLPDGRFYLTEPFEVQLAVDRESLAERPYFQEATRTLATVVSDSFYGADSVLAVAIDVPIVDSDGEVDAHLGGVFHLRNLSRLVESERLGAATEGFLVDRQGHLIAHTDVRMVRNGLRERYAEHPLVAAFLTSASNTVASDTAEDAAPISLEHEDLVTGETVFTTFLPLRFGWGLGLTRRKADLLAEIQPVVARTTLLIALLFLAASAGAVIVARRLIRRWELAERQLEEYRINLEDKVETRTIELSKVSQQLRHEVREREDTQAILRQRENQLRQAQKMEAIGTLAGGIAHDFNNLLTGIVGGIEMALLQIPPDASANRSLRTAAKAAQRASELTRQLLTVSQRREAVFGPMNVNDVITDTVRLLERSVPETIRIETLLDESLPVVRGDRGQLEQALLNLGINARDAMPAGGVLRFSVAAVPRPPAHKEMPEGADPERVLLIEVDDTGAGMSEEIRERIFEPFFSTKGKSRGTGLGLAMVYGSVEAHGGWIEVDSRVAEGTTFSVYLPLVRVPDEPTEPIPVLGGNVQPGNETILLVDDAASVLMVGQAMLENLGYTVLTARDGIEALQVYEDHRDEIDVVMTDIVMPRAGGRDLFHELRRRGAQQPILATSGYTEGIAVQSLIDEGFAVFLPKPFHLKDLGEAVRTSLEEATAPVDVL